MEPRVAERRKGVSEDRARKRLKFILFVLIAVLVAAAVLWLIRSPILSVTAVTVTGATESNPLAYVEELDMGVGAPTMDVDAGAIRAAVEVDPWVANAEVSVVWPGTITIDVVEHVPVAPVVNSDGWRLVAADGSVIDTAPTPVGTDASIAIDLRPTAIGETTEDPLVLGGLAFIDALRQDMRVGTVVFSEGDGLYATVRSHRVRLGRPVAMEVKAQVLAALVDSGLVPGASIDLIAPSRPAVANPQVEVEVEE